MPKVRASWATAPVLSVACAVTRCDPSLPTTSPAGYLYPIQLEGRRDLTDASFNADVEHGRAVEPAQISERLAALEDLHL